MARGSEDVRRPFVENRGQPQAVLEIQPTVVPASFFQAADAGGINAQLRGERGLGSELVRSTFQQESEGGRHGPVS